MGAVYLVERADGQFEKQAALKLLPMGLDGELARRRFLNERQILARLVHPNIARLLDGGVSVDGTPYFVMDFVDGQRIDRYCEDRALDVHQIVQLVIEVAEGVQFAHRNLIIHRDIKPSNILVEHSGQVRLLDFGIAKVVAAQGDDQPTQTLQRVATAGYASPEMLRGEQMDVTSDVYSLGVVLYLLLTNRLPHDFGELSTSQRILELRRDAPRPAQLLNNKVDRDLGSVVAKALHESPTERYESITGFSEDLQRWLQQKPVLARPTSRWHSLRKFAARNRFAVAASLAMLASLIGFTSFAMYSAERSKAQSKLLAAERDRVNATREFLINIFDGAQLNLKGEEVTATDLLAAGRQRIDEELHEQPALRADMLATMGRVYRVRSDLKTWRSVLADEVSAREALGQQDSQAYFDALTSLSEAEDMNGNMEASGHYAKRMLVLAEANGDAAKLGMAYMRVGRVAHVEGNLNAAEVGYQEALVHFLKAYGPEHEHSSQANLMLGTLRAHQERHAEAYEFFREAQRVRLKLFPGDKGKSTDLYLGLARSLVALERLDEGIEIYRDMIALNSRMYGEDPPYNMYLYSGLSEAWEKRGDFERAIAAREEVSRLVGLHAADGALLALARMGMGRLLRVAGHCSDAMPLLDEALTLFRERLPDHPDRFRAKVYLGDCLAAAGKSPRALALVAEGRDELLAKLGPDHASAIEAQQIYRALASSAPSTDATAQFR